MYFFRHEETTVRCHWRNNTHTHASDWAHAPLLLSALLILPSHFVCPIKETTTAGYLFSSFAFPKIDSTSFLVIRSPSSKINESKINECPGSRQAVITSFFLFSVAFCPLPIPSII